MSRGDRRRPGRTLGRATALAAAGALVTAGLVGVGSPALAAEPPELTGSITDEVGAMGDREPEAQAAVDRLLETHRVQLFAVFVDSFDGTASGQWCDRTAERNGLGLNDYVLCVATGDRQYAYSVDDTFPLSDATLAEVATVAIEPALQVNDWAGSVIGAADGLGAALSGEPVTTPELVPGDPSPGDGVGTGGSSSWLTWLLVAVAAVLVGVVVFVVVSRRGRPRGPGSTAGSGSGPGAGPLDPWAGVRTEEMDARANALLVETDDAVRTSDQELGFAVAEFGEGAAVAFRTALDAARADLLAAFAVRQELDDEVPEDERARRAMLAEIVARCERANEGLDDVAEDFDRLRDLAARAGQELEGVRASVVDLEARVPQAEALLASLGERYPDSALAPVTDNVVQARSRLAEAKDAAGRGATALAAGDNGAAALAVQAARQAVGQAGTLLESVSRAESDLATARAALEAAVAETRRDLAEAAALRSAGSLGPGADPLVAAAQAALASVEAELASDRLHPVTAVRRVEEGDRALDAALAGVRDAAARAQRARVAFDQAVVAARAEVDAAADFIETRRGAVGSQARTRLAEAQRSLAEAYAAVATDPVYALALAQRADQLAEEAGRLARQDASVGVGDGGGGGIGGLIIGGILVGALGEALGGGGGHHRGGGFGGGIPGSFGGSGTRRRGGGGRF